MQKLHLFHDEVSAASRDNKSQLSHVEEVLRDQRSMAQAGLDALQAELQQGSSDARVAAITQLQGIAEVITKQQQFKRAAAIGYENIAGIRRDVHNLRAVINDNSHQAIVRSDAFMAEVREDIAQATITLSAQIEEDRRMNAEVMQELQSISDRLVPLSDVGSEQLPNLQSLLQSLSGMLSDMQLEMRTRRQKRPTSVTTEACPTENDGCSEMKMSPDSEINRLMTKICHFAGMMKTGSYSKETQSVIEDIGRLLGFVMQQVSGTSPSRGELLSKRKILGEYDFSKLETEVESVENLRKAKRALTAFERIRMSSQG